MSELYDPKDPTTETADEEENVVSVWYGERNAKFFRRRYFDGYTFYETLEPNGKRVTHSVYTGTWYIQELTKQQRVRRRLLYFLLWLAAAAALAVGSTRVIPINARAYGAAPAFAGLLGLGWMLVALINECTLTEQRTVGDYRASSLGLQRSGLMTVISCAIAAVLTVIFGCIGGKQAGLHALAAGCELVAGAAGFLVRYLEAKVPYRQERSKDAGKYTM